MSPYAEYLNAGPCKDLLIRSGATKFKLASPLGILKTGYQALLINDCPTGSTGSMPDESQYAFGNVIDGFSNRPDIRSLNSLRDAFVKAD
ncbi:hypothetical protein ACLOJK_009713 [Asimina triloba]